MLAFPWLTLILLLALVAALLSVVAGALDTLVKERRARVVRPPLRLLVVLTGIELLLVLLWGLVVRPGLG